LICHTPRHPVGFNYKKEDELWICLNTTLRNKKPAEVVEKEICEICGCVTGPGAIEQHHIVPTQVTKQAGVPGSACVNLCHNCYGREAELKPYPPLFLDELAS